jgi:hypothetical protein
VKENYLFKRGRMSRALAVCAGVIAACAAMPAFAVLGGQPMSAPQGASAAKATVRAAVPASGASSTSSTASTSSSTYTVNSTLLGSGTTVNEYMGSDGTVFGIAWKGPRMPNLAALLGSYFPQFQQSVNAQRAARGGRGPVSVQDSGLVVDSGGHMGAFVGRAYLPQSLPAGVSASDIQ